MGMRIPQKPIFDSPNQGLTQMSTLPSASIITHPQHWHLQKERATRGEPPPLFLPPHGSAKDESGSRICRCSHHAGAAGSTWSPLQSTLTTRPLPSPPEHKDIATGTLCHRHWVVEDWRHLTRSRSDLGGNVGGEYVGYLLIFFLNH